MKLNSFHIFRLACRSQLQMSMLRSSVLATSAHKAMSGPIGYIIGKHEIYSVDTESSEEALEVDFVQGMWTLRSEWLSELLAGAAQEREETLPSIHVFLSSVLWGRLGVRTIIPPLYNSDLISVSILQRNF